MLGAQPVRDAPGRPPATGSARLGSLGPEHQCPGTLPERTPQTRPHRRPHATGSAQPAAERLRRQQ